MQMITLLYKRILRNTFFKTISFYDKNIEGFHHGLVLGLVAIIDNRYNIKSNRESGKGRYGVCLKPKNNSNPGIIIEIKH